MRGINLAKVAREMMKIHAGDRIQYDSYKACENAAQLNRHNTSIVATGTVLEVTENYVLVKLKHITEYVSWPAIRTVNGIGWHYYLGT